MMSFAPIAFVMVMLAGDSVLDQYALTMPNIRKMAAAYEGVDAAAKKDPAIAARWKGDDDVVLDIDQVIAKHQADPAIRKAFEDAGISVRDGVLTLAALAQAAGGAYVAAQTGQPPTGANTYVANVTLYQKNHAEIEVINQKIRAMAIQKDPEPDE